MLLYDTMPLLQSWTLDFTCIIFLGVINILSYVQKEQPVGIHMITHQ